MGSLMCASQSKTEYVLVRRSMSPPRGSGPRFVDNRTQPKNRRARTRSGRLARMPTLGTPELLAAANFTATSIAVLVVGGVLALVFAVLFVVRWTMSFPDLPAPGPETSELGSRAARGRQPAREPLQGHRRRPRPPRCSTSRRAGHLELFEVGPRPLRGAGRGGARATRSPSTRSRSWRSCARRPPAARRRSRRSSSTQSPAELAQAVREGGRRRRARRAACCAAGGRASTGSASACCRRGAALLAARPRRSRSPTWPRPRRAATASTTRNPASGSWPWRRGVARDHGGDPVARLACATPPPGDAAASRWLGVKRFLQHDAAVRRHAAERAWRSGTGCSPTARRSVPRTARWPASPSRRRTPTWRGAGSAAPGTRCSVEYPTRFGYGAAAVSPLLAKALLRTVGFGRARVRRAADRRRRGVEHGRRRARHARRRRRDARRSGSCSGSSSSAARRSCSWRARRRPRPRLRAVSPTSARPR